MSKPFFIPTSKAKLPRSLDALDVAARYLVYKLHEATRGSPETWCDLELSGDKGKAAARAVERGWLLIREERQGKTALQTTSLTEIGRQLARRARRN